MAPYPYPRDAASGTDRLARPPCARAGLALYTTLDGSPLSAALVLVVAGGLSMALGPAHVVGALLALVVPRPLCGLDNRAETEPIPPGCAVQLYTVLPFHPNCALRVSAARGCPRGCSCPVEHNSSALAYLPAGLRARTRPISAEAMARVYHPPPWAMGRGLGSGFVSADSTPRLDAVSALR